MCLTGKKKLIQAWNKIRTNKWQHFNNWEKYPLHVFFLSFLWAIKWLLKIWKFHELEFWCFCGVSIFFLLLFFVHHSLSLYAKKAEWTFCLLWWSLEGIKSQFNNMSTWHDFSFLGNRLQFVWYHLFRTKHLGWGLEVPHFEVTIPSAGEAFGAEPSS